MVVLRLRALRRAADAAGLGAASGRRPDRRALHAASGRGLAGAEHRPPRGRGPVAARRPTGTTRSHAVAAPRRAQLMSGARWRPSSGCSGTARPCRTTPSPIAERELTARGERQALAAGAALARARRWSSTPATRARRSGRSTPPSSPAARSASSRSSRSALADGLRPRRRARAAATRTAPTPRVLVVGHEPDVLAGRPRLHRRPRGLQEGRRGRGARASAASGELLVLLRPRELESLASARRDLASARDDHRQRDLGARLAARPRARTRPGCAPRRRAGRARRP